MRIGVLSDTHGRLRPTVLTEFAGVDHILHAGDVGNAGILVELQTVAPVTAVFGNVDSFDIRAQLPEVAELDAEGRRIAVVHGHQLGSPTPLGLRSSHPRADVVVFGHTHQPTLEWLDDRLFLNPGAAGPPRFNLKPSIALLEIRARGAEVRFIEL